MIELLMPLGLIGLLGIVALIIIYLIKPNYQRKAVSSTFVWKMSLRYRKKQIPISRLRNILLIIVQVLFLAICALLLAFPVISGATVQQGGEVVAILDASAGMRAGDGQTTRFERAVSGIRDLAERTFGADERLTVIMAGQTASYLVQRSDAGMAEDVYGKLDALTQNDSCSYGNADVEGAIALAEDVLDLNPDAEVYLYTGTQYVDDGDITIVDVSEETEWNAAVLDVQAAVVENYYTFTVSVSCIGRDRELALHFDFSGVNYDKDSFSWTESVLCTGNQTVQVTLDTGSYGGVGVYSFDSLRVYVNEDDSLAEDNSLYYYGARQSISIQYASSRPNTFFESVLGSLRDNSYIGRQWSIDLVRTQTGETPATEGYDIYIFEYMVPEVIPTDGIVIFISPEEKIADLNMIFGADPATGEFVLSEGVSSPITDGINPSDITVSQYIKVSGYDQTEYTPLLYIGDDPALLMRDDKDAKILLMTFSLNYSNQSMLYDFPVLILNLFNYYFPYSVTDPETGSLPVIFDVGDTAALDSGLGSAVLTMPDGTLGQYSSFPAEVSFTMPGSYVFSQTLLYTHELRRSFYVKIPEKQSNIWRTDGALPTPYPERENEISIMDLLVYFSAALLVLVVAEWLIQVKSNF